MPTHTIIERRPSEEPALRVLVDSEPDPEAATQLQLFFTGESRTEDSKLQQQSDEPLPDALLGTYYLG